jgi:hypothetical protein
LKFAHPSRFDGEALDLLKVRLLEIGSQSRS